jgi:hypothetical protein
VASNRWMETPGELELDSWPGRTGVLQIGLEKRVRHRNQEMVSAKGQEVELTDGDLQGQRTC